MEHRHFRVFIVINATIIFFLLLASQAAGVKAKDWLLSVNGVNTRFLSHGEVVSMIKECKEEVTFELTTPEHFETPSPTDTPQ